MGEQVERMAGNARPTAVAMIDEQTGIVRFDEIEIGPATCRSAFERSDAGGEGPIAISPGRWRKKFTGTCYGRTFIVELYFHGNRLHSVFVNDAHSPLTLPLSVSAEGEVKELLRQLANEKNWIQEHLPTKSGDYPWGVISVSWEPETGVSPLIIAYRSRLSRTFPLLSHLIRNVGAGTVVLLVLLLIALSIMLRLGVGSR